MTRPGIRWRAVFNASGATVAVVAALGVVWACWRHRAFAGEWHHLYLGLGVAVAGGVLRRPGVLWLGAAIAVDDAWQHVLQVAGAWSYVSPLHALYGHYLWQYALVRRVTAWLNALFA